MNSISRFRSPLVFIILLSHLGLVACSSVSQISQQSGSVKRSAEELVLTSESALVMKSGPSIRLKADEGRLEAEGELRWITPAQGRERIMMRDVAAIILDVELIATRKDGAVLEFPRGRWKFQLEEGELEAIDGAAHRSNDRAGEGDGLVLISLDDIESLSIREPDALKTFGLITGIGALVFVVVLSVALSDLDFSFDSGLGKW